MHAVVVRVAIQDREAAEKTLREEVVPQVSQAPGFVAGYWLGKDDSGLSVAVFESEEAANAMAERVREVAPPQVSVEEVEVREVVAHA